MTQRNLSRRTSRNIPGETPDMYKNIKKKSIKDFESISERKHFAPTQKIWKAEGHRNERTDERDDGKSSQQPYLPG